MAFASFDRQRSAAPMAEINMVPLIDVLLVLLVIFIVTAPLLTYAVKLDLPRARSPHRPRRPRTACCRWAHGPPVSAWPAWPAWRRPRPPRRRP